MSKARLMAVAAIGLLVAACGGDSDAATATATGDDGTTLSITAPSDGAQVSVPFTVEVDSSEEIGATDTGLHHVHVYWDGDESAFTLVETDSVEITDAPEGQHTLTASLHNPDHTPAGVEVDITLTVGDGGESDDGGGYGY